GVVEPGRKCGGLSKVAPETNDLETRVALVQIAHNGPALIAAAVVDEQDFPIQLAPCSVVAFVRKRATVQRGLQRVVEAGQALFLIVNGDHYRKIDDGRVV